MSPERPRRPRPEPGPAQFPAGRPVRQAPGAPSPGPATAPVRRTSTPSRNGRPRPSTSPRSPADRSTPPSHCRRSPSGRPGITRSSTARWSSAPSARSGLGTATWSGWSTATACRSASVSGTPGRRSTCGCSLAARCRGARPVVLGRPDRPGHRPPPRPPQARRFDRRLPGDPRRGRRPERPDRR